MRVCIHAGVYVCVCMHVCLMQFCNYHLEVFAIDVCVHVSMHACVRVVGMPVCVMHYCDYHLDVFAIDVRTYVCVYVSMHACMRVFVCMYV
jgi:hypothetical protein